MNRWALTLPAGLVLAATVASAGAPLLSEDAGVLAPRECEVEAAWASARVGGVSATGQALAGACGVADGLQLGLGYERASSQGLRAKGLSLGGKIRLWQGAGDAGLVLAPALFWADDGQGWQRAGEEFKLAYSRPLAEDWTLHVNLSHANDRGAGERSTGVSLAAEHGGWSVGDMTVAPMGDLAFDDRGAPWWNLALRVTVVPDRFWLGLAYARQIDPDRAREAVLSLKLAF